MLGIYPDFVRVGSRRVQETCWAAFRAFDLDGSGSITRDELRKVRTSLLRPNVHPSVEEMYYQDTPNNLYNA